MDAITSDSSTSNDTPIVPHYAAATVSFNGVEKSLSQLCLQNVKFYKKLININ